MTAMRETFEISRNHVQVKMFKAGENRVSCPILMFS